jgi:hypothetical protein
MSVTYAAAKAAKSGYYGPTASEYSDTRIEAVVVCLDYADFLEQTLPHNLPHVDRLVVVTGREDKATKAICEKWSVECVATDAFTEKGDIFNKGHAINMAMSALRQRGWILHLDADIVLPLQFRNMLDKSALKPDCLYGAERVNVVGWHRWEHLRKDFFEKPQFSYRYMMSTPADLPIGANVIHKQYGYAPIGYFQLWHSRFMHENDLRYPDTEGSAEHADMQWALRWPRGNRLLLPTVRVFHLESEKADMGVNWGGRRTKPFQPPRPPSK